MNIKFVIRAWAAWAPGLHDRARWLAWAGSDAAALPAGAGEVPAVAEMPALARRRLNTLGRSAAQVIYQLAADVAPDGANTNPDSHTHTPMLLASRYGDASRALALMDEAARGEAVSPTAFSLSVHNAIGAVVAIARSDTSPQGALAGGACSAGHALVEAAGWLADGTPELALVCYDEPLPGEYAAFADEAPAAYAWAWRIAAAGVGEPAIQLQLTPEAADLAVGVPTDPRTDGPVGPSAELPFGLALLRFALRGERGWERVQEGQRWRWQRDA